MAQRAPGYDAAERHEASVGLRRSPASSSRLTSRVERQFAEWIETPAGRYVEAEVVSRARDLRARGYTRYGIAALIEVVRYHCAVPADGRDEYRINNNVRSLLARKVMAEYSDLAGFFEVRGLRGMR